jgi:hypothetical protein
MSTTKKKNKDEDTYKLDNELLKSKTSFCMIFSINWKCSSSFVNVKKHIIVNKNIVLLSTLKGKKNFAAQKHTYNFARCERNNNLEFLRKFVNYGNNTKRLSCATT